MIHNAIAIFLTVLLIIILGSVVFRRLHIPPIVGMILAGIAVGPYGFNLLERDASFRIFGEVGILYIMFQAAVEIDMYHLKAQLRSGMFFGLLSFLLPMAGGILGTHYILGASWITSILVASMYASHTLVTYPVISRFGLQNTRPAVIAVCGTIIAVMLALFCLAGVVQTSTNGGVSWRILIRMIILMALFVGLVGFIFPFLTRRFFRTNTDPVIQYIFILALVFIASLVSQLIGLEAIFGAFYAGLVLNKLIPGKSLLMRNIRFLGNAIFVPYFLIGVGMLIDVRVVVQSWNMIWVAANMTVIALGCKWLVAYITQRVLRLSPTDGSLMFGLTGGKAAATIAAVMIGYQYSLLDEDMMNAAVVMILICCLVASLFTEHSAKRLRMQMMSDRIAARENIPVEEARQLVPVSNPLTSEGLMRLALLMRQRTNTSPVYALFLRSNDERRAIEMGHLALQGAMKIAEEMEIPIEPVERFDLNIVSGISNLAMEKHCTEIVIGLHHRASVIDSFFGPIIENLLSHSNKMIFLSRCFIPVYTIERMMVVVPRGAEYETGFKLWVTRLVILAVNIEASITFLAYSKTTELLKGLVNELKPEIGIKYDKLASWDDFILMSGDVGEDDILVVISARKGSISYGPDVEQMPGFLQRYFKRHNLLVCYPQQF